MVIGAGTTLDWVVEEVEIPQEAASARLLVI
jgi:hypothetical protein